MIRAAASDRGAAELMGINVNRVNMLAFGMGIGCLGVAAPLMMPVYYVVPDIGTFFILIAFVVVVLGGAGQFCWCHARKLSGGDCAVNRCSFYAWLDCARASFPLVHLGSPVQA